MLNKNTVKQNKLIVTTMEMLMPQDHFLRDLDKYVDFSFIYEKVAHLYSNLGRRSVDPVVLVKMLLLGFLYGIDSERKLEKETQVNIAFRWFLEIDLDEPVPDHSTISQTRRRKWRGSTIFEDIFTEIVQKCIDAGLVDGSLILTDSTHVKVNASSDRKETVAIQVTPREYIKKLDKLCEQEESKIRADAVSKGKKKHGPKPNKSHKNNFIEKSTTDLDCGVLARVGKPKGFHYLNHQSVDSKSGIITDVFVSPGNVLDFEPYVDRIKYQINKYNFRILEVGLDRGYDCTEIHKEMYDLGIKTFMPFKDMEGRTSDRIYPPSVFAYDSVKDVYTCPNGFDLRYSSIDKTHHKKIYRASVTVCKICPLNKMCIGDNIKCRTLHIPFFKEEADIQRANYGTKRYYEVQRKRRIYCEGNFALQNDNHNLRRTRKRGNATVTEHCLCSALALNLKRLVKYLKYRDYPGGITQIFKQVCKLSQEHKRGFDFSSNPLFIWAFCQHTLREYSFR